MPPLLCSAAEARDETDSYRLAHLTPGLPERACRSHTRTPGKADSNPLRLQLQFNWKKNPTHMYPPLKKLLESPALCFSLQMIFICGLVTGGEEFPHKEPPRHGAIHRHCRATLETHRFLPGAGFCQSREPKFPDIRGR